LKYNFDPNEDQSKNIKAAETKKVETEGQDEDNNAKDENKSICIGVLC
jgi:hypothetical protein